SGCAEPAEMWPLRGLKNEKDGSKGWDNNMKLRGVTRHNGRYLSGVPHIAPSVGGGIGIEDFAPSAGKGHAHAIVAQHLRREIHDDDAAFVGLPGFSEPRENAVAGVVGDEPFEAAGVAIKRVQCRQVAVEPVEIADQTLDAGVGRLLKQMPGKADIVVPFAVLAELRTHEQQLLAGMAVHE